MPVDELRCGPVGMHAYDYSCTGLGGASSRGRRNDKMQVFSTPGETESPANQMWYNT